jgi:hypothetical protein
METHLKPAEEWLKLAFNGQPALLDQPQIREPSLKFYRQIQANAIRWAAVHCVDTNLNDTANQLDPLPEPKEPIKMLCKSCDQPIHQEQRMGSVYWTHTHSTPRHIAEPKDQPHD